MRLKTITICFLTVIFLLSGLSSSATERDGLLDVNTGYMQDQSIEIGYPTVDKLEKKVLGRVYSNQNIYARLDRLEKVVFGRVTNAHLCDRVDKLSETALPSSKNYSTSRSNLIFGQDYQEKRSYNNYNYNGSQNYSSSQNSDYSMVLFDLEKQFLGTTYPAESTNVRLTRLENHLFSESMQNYPVQARIQRLTAYADARDSDEFYENQAQRKQYKNIVNGARALSVLFMILQFFL